MQELEVSIIKNNNAMGNWILDIGDFIMVEF